ncbi:hypothetical protein JCM10049v2_006882 [Rhodotorula toruloides]
MTLAVHPRDDPPPPPSLRPSTSRARPTPPHPQRRDKAAGDSHPRGVHGDSSALPGHSLKGKEREWSIELAVVERDGSRRVVEANRPGEGAGTADGAREGVDGIPGMAEGGSDASHASEWPSSRSSALLGDPSASEDGRTASTSSNTPPPAAEPASKPSRPPLQSILKRPQPARTPSTSSHHLAFSPAVSSSAEGPITTLPSAYLPLPPAASPSHLQPTTIALGPPSPDSFESKGKSSASSPTLPHAHTHTHGVLFSTPGTTTSVLPLSSPSHGSHYSHDPDGPVDPTSTFKSWKSSIMGRRSGLYDKKRLAALGFDEELSRDYDFFASWGISLCNIGGLPGTVLGVLTALEAGGGSMYAIAWPLSGLFMISLAAVLGEMASTWPVAGAMFTWVFRLCRSKKSLNPWARYASWVVGSLLLCSHVLLQIVVTWQFAHIILGVVGLWTERNYSFWVTVAISWGTLCFSALVVSSRLSRSPWLWRVCGFLIVAFFLIINIILLTKSERIFSAKYVFTSYRNSTGFTSKSYVYMIGWVLTCVATGMEASAHMAEDTKRPSRTVPLAMFWSVAATYAMGWVSICVLLATMNIDGADPALQPSIALIANSIPRKYTAVILICVVISLLFQNVAQLLATSRYIWALSRESALPFSNFFRRLSKTNRTPTAAIWVTWAIACPALLFLAINMSIIATTLLEGAGITCTASYVAPILLYLVCDRDVLRGDGRAKWTLRGASKPLAVPVALFLLVFIVTMCLPTGYPVTSLNVSYASAMLVGVLLLSSTAWVLYGNSHYAGPIKTTTRWTIGAEVDLPSTSSQGGPGGTKKKSTAHAHVTTSAHHGRTAHVWATSGTDGSGEWTSTETGGPGRDMHGVRTGETGMSASMTGSEYTSEYTSEEGSSEEEGEGSRSPSRSRSRDRGSRQQVDEERSIR